MDASTTVSEGALVGIACGGFIIFGILISMLIYYACRRQFRRKEMQSLDFDARLSLPKNGSDTAEINLGRHSSNVQYQGTSSSLNMRNSKDLVPQIQSSKRFSRGFLTYSWPLSTSGDPPVSAIITPRVDGLARFTGLSTYRQKNQEWVMPTSNREHGTEVSITRVEPRTINKSKGSARGSFVRRLHIDNQLIPTLSLTSHRLGETHRPSLAGASNQKTRPITLNHLPTSLSHPHKPSPGQLESAHKYAGHFELANNSVLSHIPNPGEMVPKSAGTAMRTGRVSLLDEDDDDGISELGPRRESLSVLERFEDEETYDFRPPSVVIFSPPQEPLETIASSRTPPPLLDYPTSIDGSSACRLSTDSFLDYYTSPIPDLNSIHIHPNSLTRQLRRGCHRNDKWDT